MPVHDDFSECPDCQYKACEMCSCSRSRGTMAFFRAVTRVFAADALFAVNCNCEWSNFGEVYKSNKAQYNYYLEHGRPGEEEDGEERGDDEDWWR